jgi:hypothetical protein
MHFQGFADGDRTEGLLEAGLGARPGPSQVIEPCVPLQAGGMLGSRFSSLHPVRSDVSFRMVPSARFARSLRGITGDGTHGAAVRVQALCHGPLGGEQPVYASA